MRHVAIFCLGAALSACSADTFVSGAVDAGIDGHPADADTNDAVVVDGGVGDALPVVPAWTPVLLPGSDTSDLAAVWGSSYNDVWVVGASGYVAHWNGTKFESVAGFSGVKLGATDLRGVWGRGTKDVIAVGKTGALFRSANGSPWAAVLGGATVGKDLVAAGAFLATYYIQSVQGQQFSFDPPTDVLAKDIGSGQFSGTEVCNGMHARRAVCNGGVLLDPIASPSNWVRDDLGSPDLFGVWSTPFEIAVVGAGGKGGLAVGGSALNIQKVANDDLYGVWVSEDRKQTFAVGNNGTILRGDIINGAALGPAKSGVTKNLRAVFGVTDGQSRLHIFAVGALGTVLKLDL